MAKIKLTKGELKKQRDSLKQFKRYLPTLQLKKQQLQMNILEARKELKRLSDEIEFEERKIKKWVGLLAEPRVDIREWLRPEDIKVKMTNVAGANVPVYEDIVFSKSDYDYYATPFWIDKGFEKLKDHIRLSIQMQVIKVQIRILEKELRTTTQRVNLFEKVKIPECQENIRKIGIYLGDQQANAVGIGKVAKKKVEERNLQLV